MRSVGVFVNYMSCVEEGRYCEYPDAVLSKLAECTSPSVTSGLEAFESVYGRSFQQEIVEPRLLIRSDLDTLRAGRAAQQLLYWYAVEHLKMTHQICYLAGYSMGYTVAFMAAGALTAKTLLSDVMPANRVYAADNFAALQDGGLSSAFLYCPTNLRFNETVKVLMQTAHPDVRVKDDRPPYSLQIAGPAKSVRALRATVLTRFPEAAATSAESIASDSAHLTPERYRQLEQRFKELALSRLLVDVVTHLNGTLTPSDRPPALGAALFNALQGRMNMSAVNDVAKDRELPLVLFGSKRVNRFAFHGFGDTAFSLPTFSWEDLLLDRSPTPLHRSSKVTW